MVCRSIFKATAARFSAAMQVYASICFRTAHGLLLLLWLLLLLLMVVVTQRKGRQPILIHRPFMHMYHQTCRQVQLQAHA
jgi:hypothetical protein